MGETDRSRGLKHVRRILKNVDGYEQKDVQRIAAKDRRFTTIEAKRKGAWKKHQKKESLIVGLATREEVERWNEAGRKVRRRSRRPKDRSSGCGQEDRSGWKKRSHQKRRGEGASLRRSK